MSGDGGALDLLPRRRRPPQHLLQRPHVGGPERRGDVPPVAGPHERGEPLGERGRGLGQRSQRVGQGAQGLTQVHPRLPRASDQRPVPLAGWGADQESAREREMGLERVAEPDHAGGTGRGVGSVPALGRDLGEGRLERTRHVLGAGPGSQRPEGQATDEDEAPALVVQARRAHRVPQRELGAAHRRLAPSAEAQAADTPNGGRHRISRARKRRSRRRSPARPRRRSARGRSRPARRRRPQRT